MLVTIAAIPADNCQLVEHFRPSDRLPRYTHTLASGISHLWGEWLT